MQNWFRLQTSDAALQDPKSGDFGSLYMFVRVLFGTGYGVLMVASIFIAIMAMMVYAIMLMTSSGRGREETKKKIQNGCIAVVVIFFTLSLVTLIFGIFFGMSDYHA